MKDKIVVKDYPRLLVIISFSFSIRFLYRTGMLHRLRKFSTPVIVITWNQQDLVEELKNDGFEVHIVKESKKGIKYTEIRTKIDYWFRHYALKSETKNNQEKYLDQYFDFKNRTIRNLRKSFNIYKTYIPGYTRRLFLQERKLLEADTNFNEMLELIDRLNIDAVFTPTPFHTQEDILLRAAKQRGKKMITSILSFDNLTKRGWIPVEYDIYMVWNKYNYQEAKTIYPKATANNNVFITGAAQFDFYYQKEFLYSKSEWQKHNKIYKPDKKVILYAGGPKALFPNEWQYVKHLIDAIDKNEIEGSPLILFRCHPIDNIERWKHHLGEHPNLIFVSSWTGKEKFQYSNITREDILNLCSTLAYTDVHINLCSTMSVDGSAFKKPQIGPCYDDINPKMQHLLQGMYLQDHFKPVIKTQGLLLPKSKQEMVSCVNAALKNPADFIAKSDLILKEIITFIDGKSTDRTVDIIKDNL